MTLRLSASVSMMFRELPVLDRFAAARAGGFYGVEIQRLSEGEPDEMKRAALDAGVDVVLINVGTDDFLDGGPGLSGVPGREAKFRAALEYALAAAATLGAHHIHLGPSRIPEGVSAEDCRRVYDANIQLALQLSRSTEASLLIEAMNPVDVPAALVPSSDAAAAVIDAHRDPRLGLQFDIYHTAMGREEPLSVFARHAALVRHVQFADAPGRHEPGTGRLNIPEILGGIARAGYAGWYGAEYRPSGVTSDGLGWIATLHPGTAA